MSKLRLNKPTFDNLSLEDSSNYVISLLGSEIMSRSWARQSKVLSKRGKIGLFETKPVSTVEFFQKYYSEPCYPRQQGLMDAIFGTDPYKWSTDYQKFVALWGMGSGKDHTVAKAFVYAAHWLNCLYDPQSYFGLGRGTAIDFVNYCISGYEAKQIFFRAMKTVLFHTYTPGTQENWFTPRGMDVREGFDVQDRLIKFPKNVLSHSLDSQHQSGIGMNLLLAVFDEIGGFKYHDAKAICDNVIPTQISRFKESRKTLFISFPREPNDYMMSTYESSKAEDGTWCDMGSTWEINEGTKKEDFVKFFIENPEVAERVYKCVCRIGENAYFRYKELIRYSVNYKRPSPIIGNKHRTFDISQIRLKDWFRGMKGVSYFGHIDGAKNKDDKSDAAGIALTHNVRDMPVKVDNDHLEKLKKDLGFDISSIIKTGDRGDGVFVDLMLQVRARHGREVIFQDIIDFFIYLVRERKFQIKLVTFDGFSSVGEIQRMRSAGIPSGLLSVDKVVKQGAKNIKASPHDTMKSLIYSGLFDTYLQPIFIRECEELIWKGDKIDHPEISSRRYLMEGVKNGSKDVSDAVVGSTYNAKMNFNFELAAWWGDMSAEIDNIYYDDIMYTPDIQEGILQGKLSDRARLNATRMREQVRTHLVRRGEVPAMAVDEYGY